MIEGLHPCQEDVQRGTLFSWRLEVVLTTPDFTTTGTESFTEEVSKGPYRFTLYPDSDTLVRLPDYTYGVDYEIFLRSVPSQKRG